jgi:hypothetical protein
MNELAIFDQWLTSKLTGDATIGGIVADRVYGDVAPEKTTFPYILFTQQSTADVMGNGAQRIMVTGVYVVRGVAPSESYTTLRTLADRIDTVLHKASGQVATGTVIACVRERPFSMTETEKGVQYRHFGGVYRIYSQA